MTKRNSVALNDPSVTKLPMNILNHKIALARFGYDHGGTSQSRRAFFKLLVSLEGQRERFYGIAARKRRFSRM
jgi:hypothetical protein